jgi:hypothetical protein
MGWGKKKWLWAIVFVLWMETLAPGLRSPLNHHWQWMEGHWKVKKLRLSPRTVPMSDYEMMWLMLMK